MIWFTTPPSTIGYYWFISSGLSRIKPEIIHLVRKTTGELVIERFGGVTFTLSDFIKKYPKGEYKECRFE